ncbi:MAG: ATP-binding protein [Candidatus Marithrix sp.]
MLIEFKVTNFRSINSTQTLSMVVAPIPESNLTDNIFPSEIKDLENLVKLVAIYGANAAGKSNLIDAMDFVQSFVRNSAKESQSGENINIVPFLLDEENSSLLSEFELSFVIEEILYEYGFALNNEQVIHEWLFVYPQGKAQRWFERIYDEETKQYDWSINTKHLTGQRKLWQITTRNNALFLSTAGMLNSIKLEPIINWIVNNLIVSTVGTRFPKDFTFNFCKDSNNKQRVLDLLQVADLNIVDFKVVGGKLIFIHNINESNELIEFPEEFESEGTRRLFAFAGPFLMDILENGKILFIDELDSSLHPSMVRFIVELIHNPKLNRHNAQIVFTTHDSSILDNNLLRRDQIWFVEKDKQQSTQLYPLTDFKPRPNEFLQKGYLEGRYGALPFIGDLEDFNGK